MLRSSSMKQLAYTYLSIPLGLLCLILVVSSSCKKETIYAPSSLNRILGFSVVAPGGESLQGSVQGDSLVVYWPSYLAIPDSVSTEIEVSEDAVVEPGAGTKIALKTGTAFKVVAANNEYKTYYLKLVVNQPGIELYELNGFSTIKGGAVNIQLYTILKYIIEDTTVTKFWLQNEAGDALSLPWYFTEQGGSRFVQLKVPNDPAYKEGAYALKIESGTVSYLSSNAIFGILYPGSAKPKADNITEPITVKRGETITFSGSGFFDMKEARLFGYDANWNEQEIGTFTLENFTETSVTYKVPDNFPAGTYELGGWDTDGIFIQLRTSDFIGNWSWSGSNKVYVNIDGNTSFTVE